MKRWALYDPEDGTCDLHNTRQEAVTAMKQRFDAYLGDGTWNEDVEELFVAQITDIPEQTNMKHRADMTPQDWDDTTDGADCDKWYQYTTKPVDQ